MEAGTSRKKRAATSSGRGTTMMNSAIYQRTVKMIMKATEREKSIRMDLQSRKSTKVKKERKSERGEKKQRLLRQKKRRRNPSRRKIRS
jgi:hypothetical protein